jgi:hypothetical protein
MELVAAAIITITITTQNRAAIDELSDPDLEP